jgi:hypothetical protein
MNSADRAPGAAGRVALSLLAWPPAPPCCALVNDIHSPALSIHSLPLPSHSLSCTLLAAGQLRLPLALLRPCSCCSLLDSLLGTPPSEALPPALLPLGLPMPSSALMPYNATTAWPRRCHSQPPPRHAAHARGWTFPGQGRPSQALCECARSC